MSKTDAMRAMKQARAEAAAASRPAPAAARPAAARPAPARASAAPAPAAEAADGAVPVEGLVPEALCGHQAIGGKRCTRPQGHAEKNHRYAA